MLPVVGGRLQVGVSRVEHGLGGIAERLELFREFAVHIGADGVGPQLGAVYLTFCLGGVEFGLCRCGLSVETVELDLGTVGRFRQLLDLDVEVVDLPGDRLRFGLPVAQLVGVRRGCCAGGDDQA